MMINEHSVEQVCSDSDTISQEMAARAVKQFSPASASPR
jgi:hypothetical protein